MKVKQDVARSTRSCVCTSCLFRSESQRSSVRKLHQTGPKIDKNYYGKFISLRERILLGKLFGDVYDDITQMLPVSNARDHILAEQKSCVNLPLNEENIKEAKSSLIGHALKIIETDKAIQSEKLSECWNSCTYGSIPFREHDFILHTHDVNASRDASRCRVEAETRLGKQQAQHLNSDICTSKFKDWEGKHTRTEKKKMIEKNDVTRYDHPFKMFDDAEISFNKNDIKTRQTRLAGENKPESLTKINISPPILHAQKVETGFQIPLENIENGTSDIFKQIYTRLKQSPPVIHRPPYNFMITPRISLYNINNSESKIKKTIDKEAVGDTPHKTVIKSVTNPYDRFSLKRCLCTLALKPQNNKIDLLMVAKAVRNFASKSSLHSKSVSARSKIINRSKKIKKTNKKIVAKVRQRSLNNCYILKEKTKLQKQGTNLRSHFNPAVEVSKEKPANNLNHFIALHTEKGKNNRNVANVENLPPTCGMFMNSLTNHSLRRCFCTLKLDKPHTKNCCKSRESVTSRQITSPVAKYQTNDINKASAIKEWKIDKRDISPCQCNLSYNPISHRSFDCKPEIIGFDKVGSTCQNTIYTKTSHYGCKLGNVHDKYNPQENVEIINKIEQNKRHINHNFKIFETDFPVTKPSVSTIKNSIMTETVQSKKQVIKGLNVKQMPDNLKRNQAVQINSSCSFEMEKETLSPIACDAKIHTYSRPSIDTKNQEIKNDKHNKSSETDNYFEKNVFVQSNFQKCFCTLIDKTTLDNTLCSSFWKEKNPRKEQGTNIESFYQDTILHRDTLNHFEVVSDVSRNTSFSFTTIKQEMDTNFNKNHADVSTVKKKKLSSDTKNMVFSRQPQSRKNGNLYVPNDKPYLIHGVSNKHRHDNNIVKLLHERPIKCKTSSSSFSSMIGATTTDSSHSFPREKYKNNRQSTSNGVNNGYYKSSFYALYINVKNTRRNERKYKLEPYECEPGACYPEPGKCDPIECDKLIKKRLMRKSSKTSTDDGIQSVSSGQANIYSNNNNAAPSAKRHPKYSTKQGLQYRTFPPSRSRRGAKQAVRISSSFSFNIEFSKNTAPAHEKRAVKEQHAGREYDGRETYAGREKLPKTRSKSIFSQKSTAGIRRPIDRKRMRSEGTGEIKQSDACMKTCPKCLNIGTYCPCPKLQHTESQSEPEMQHVGINTHSKRCFCTLKLHKSGRIYRDRAVKAKKLNLKPKVYKERGQKARAGYEPDYDTITVANKEQNKREPMPELELFECEPNTCIPGECDPYVCLERIKKRCLGTKDDMSSTYKAKSAREPQLKEPPLKEYRNDESSRQVTRIGSNFSFNVEFFKNRTGFDNTYKSAAPSRKKRHRALNNDLGGGATTVGLETEEDKSVSYGGTQYAKDDVVNSAAAQTAGRPRQMKNMSIMMVGDNTDCCIQSTKELRNQDSQVNTPARYQKATKTGQFLQRCFCTAKLYGIKVPKELLETPQETPQEKKKSKCVLL